MNPKIPIYIGVDGILATIGTAIANANGVFLGHPHLMYWFYAGSIALIITAMILAFTTGDQKKPSIVPLRFGYLSNAPQEISGRWYKPTGHAFTAEEVLSGKQYVDQGLIFMNDGEPAYHISIPKASRVGPSKLIFPGKLARLEKSQGEAVLTAAIERAPHTSIVNGLFDEMRQNNLDRVTVAVEYRGHSHQAWWATICEIVRNPHVKGGLEILKFRQERRKPSQVE